MTEEDISQPVDPKSNLVEFRRGPRVPTMEIKRPTYDACKHVRTILVQENRTVECRDCNAVLDCYEVLTQLARHERSWMGELDQWDAYRESRLADRYDEQWARDHKGELIRPEDPETAAIWDAFTAYFKGGLVRMYRRRARKRNGPDWYGVSTHGGCVSYEYARAQLIPKVVKK